MDYEYFMTKALQQAEIALAAGEFPVGCVMVHKDRIIATGAREGTTGDCTNEVDHAEMVALRRLISLKTNINLREIILFSTLEPCLMCFGALMISAIGKIIFAYEDAMGGGTQFEGLLRESGKYLLKGQSFGQLYASPINNRLKSLVPFANGIMPDKTGFLIAFFSCIS
jgi:tRNA(adenine34) deaminase